MTPAAVPTPDLGQLEQSLRSAGEHADAGKFAVGVLESLRVSGTTVNGHLRALTAETSRARSRRSPTARIS